MQLSPRIEHIHTSIRKIAELISKKENPIRFDIGEPDFDTPAHIKEAAKRALDEGKTYYSPVAGIDELREAVAGFEAWKGFPVNKDNIMLTTGATGAIMASLLGLLNPGDKVMIPEPYWAPYEMLIKAAHGVPVVKRYFEGDDLILGDPEGAKVLIVNSPRNPDGKVYSEEQLRKLAEYAKNNNLTIISDEVYDHILFDAEHHSVKKFHENTILVNSFSKTYEMTGWRLGWMVSDKIPEFSKINRALCACPNTFIQYAALEALRGDQSCIKQMVDEYRIRRDLILNEINKLGWECEKPEGALYVFPRINQDAWKFCLDLIENKAVSMVPGDAFGKPEHIRLCFGSASQEQIKQGFERLQKQ